MISFLRLDKMKMLLSRMIVENRKEVIDGHKDKWLADWLAEVIGEADKPPLISSVVEGVAIITTFMPLDNARQPVPRPFLTQVLNGAGAGTAFVSETLEEARHAHEQFEEMATMIGKHFKKFK